MYMKLQSHFIISCTLGVLLTLLFFFVATTSAVFAEVVRQQVGAAGQNDFILEPAKHDVLVVPGETQEKTISVTNRTDTALEFSIIIEDFTGSDNPSQQVRLLGDEVGPYSLKQFVQPEIDTFMLASGERITIPVTIALPEDAEPRGYYGAVIISGKNPEDGNNVGTGPTTEIITRLGSLFLVRVAGQAEESSVLELFKARGATKTFYTNHPDAFEFAVRNTGNVHLVHYGQVIIKNIFGKDVAQLPINAYFSLPDAVRYQEVSWPQSFRIGRYTAVLDIHKGYGDKDLATHQMSSSFWVIPLHVIVPILIIVILLGFGVAFITKQFEIKRKKR